MEYLDNLFHNPVNIIQIEQELQICYKNIENVILEENMNSPHLVWVDLFQIKRHIIHLIEAVQHKMKTNFSDEIPPKIQLREILAKERQQKLIEGTIQIPKSNGLKDIAGLWEVKKVLKSLIILPTTQPQLFINRKLCNSVLLFGPPGTGKTRLVHALAYEANAVLHSASVSDLVSSLVGQTEKNLQVLFDHVRSSKNSSILFIDEIDGFCRTRSCSEQDHTRRTKTEFLCQLSKMEDDKSMFLICATNCPWDLDTAFLRRFQKRIYIPLPNYIERLELLQLFTKGTELENTADKWDLFVRKTEGFSGSDLSNLVNCALNVPLVELEDTKIWKATPDGFYEPVVNSEDFNVEDIICSQLSDLPYGSVRARPVQLLDLMNSLDNVAATVSPAEIKKYESFISK
ncbi:hypothetical protein NQ318_018545 [Aromia moschata]|uniref:AAA+ ATPase domain-containing protein n=1 Tax=Aromia moschata TaxID=1265417 RepID=A0AAV8ZH67_9CUCU|nr:hypothetical protein NQ318_018545 [Aromia moschata]